jgi:hypothetical protein
MKKESFYPPMEVGRFVNTSVGETSFCPARMTRKQSRTQCWDCDGTGKVTIYPLVEISCYVCKGRGYFLELQIGFDKSREN